MGIDATLNKALRYDTFKYDKKSQDIFLSLAKHYISFIIDQNFGEIF
jgi:hypothetical protein